MDRECETELVGRLRMLMSTLPEPVAPEAAALRVRARARVALSEQRRRQQWRARMQAVVTAALAAGAGSYVVSAMVQALQAYRLVW